jgi:light-regulated signal transduction histidine kinase (bacteriophytochrome)
MAQRGFQENISSLQQRTLELERVNKELESFSYSVSHDLRAPLRSIDGFSQALYEDCFGQLDEQGKDYIRRIRKATQLMAELIDALLTLSRVTRVELKRESVDLSGMAIAIIEELQKTQPERKVEFLIEEGLTATGDLRLLRVVLENLIGNAWKFTNKQKNARIEIGLSKQSQGRPAYFVRDNGAGFDMAHVGGLFNAFQRLHSAGEFPGTGIGLATVKRIIHRHGGCVWAEAEVDKGATFYFVL